MYELKRKTKIVEQLKVGDEMLTISISPEDMWKEYRAAQVDIIKAQEAIQQAKKNGQEEDTILEQFGIAVVRFMSVMMGEENTQKILAFYENNYMEMSTEVLPFVVDVLKPQIEKAISEMRARTRDTYKKAKYGDKWNLGSKLFSK